MLARELVKRGVREEGESQTREVCWMLMAGDWELVYMYVTHASSSVAWTHQVARYFVDAMVTSLGEDADGQEEPRERERCGDDFGNGLGGHRVDSRDRSCGRAKEAQQG